MKDISVTLQQSDHSARGSVALY